MVLNILRRETKPLNTNRSILLPPLSPPPILWPRGASRMGKVSSVGVGGMMTMVVLLAVAVAMGGCSTQPTPEIKTEAPPPRPDALIMPKDCPVYVLGELRGVKKHGEKWLNDGSDCEICKCTNGQKRCYYHYCNSGLTEGYMTPPSVLGPGEKVAADQPPARPPLDDEDHLDEEEGSGAQPWPDDYYKVIQEALEHDLDLASSISQRGKNDGEEKNPQDNETHDHVSPPDLCGRPCKKTCPQGYKLDPVTGCRRCKCLNCQSLKHCLLKCPDGFALDQRGCKTCQCRVKNTRMAVITTSLDGDDFIVEEGYGVSGEAYGKGEDQVSYSEVGGHGGIYVTADDGVIATSGDNSDPACNTTHATRLQPINDRGHESRSTSRVPLDRMPPTRPHDLDHDHMQLPTEDDSPHRIDTPGEDDSTTKSAVQATRAEWSQVVVIVVPVVVVFALVASLIVHFWRRYHRDKYDINAYRPEETEKLRPVKTVDDNHQVRHV